MKNKINERLKELRTDLGFSRKDFANELGYAESTIRNWENGHRVPSIDTIMDIAVHFKVTTDYLCGLED